MGEQRLLVPGAQPRRAARNRAARATGSEAVGRVRFIETEHRKPPRERLLGPGSSLNQLLPSPHELLCGVVPRGAWDGRARIRSAFVWRQRSGEDRPHDFTHRRRGCYGWAAHLKGTYHGRDNCDCSEFRSILSKASKSTRISPASPREKCSGPMASAGAPLCGSARRSLPQAFGP